MITKNKMLYTHQRFMLTNIYIIITMISHHNKKLKIKYIHLLLTFQLVKILADQSPRVFIILGKQLVHVLIWNF